ncbi:MFS transporter [Micromonospora yangpuensis]|uniref:Predicted arabinose efflux permease, MFS family n=1 Tax=Micromonospora yangpuensis TaxID=683228 RepID=A0A1C6U124_9ACTN|nr:MFS transporter [Micromonospora yangpuensis]GGM11209.1 putative ABC transporter, permease protein [Micromonospora yangpuensis]SCL47790.1 Predicted arabinose efflux permease, MFS family [Micromonospora yangpuensis]
MSATWRTLRGFPAAIQLLVVNQFGVNVGFYLLLPFLAGYLADDVGLSAALIGLILGVRNLSQQGLFLLGGTAADRLGSRGVIIAGCALRTVGFGLFAVGMSLPVLLAASVLSGLAGALFNPAVRAYLAQAAPERRAEAFALFNVFASAGALVGPLLGGALLLVDFRAAALAAAGVFAVLTVAQALVLPAQPKVASGQSVLGDWRECVTDRRFLLFTLALSALYASQNQLYLVLPVQAEQVGGHPAAVAALFVVSTVATLAWQVPVTGWLQRHVARGPAIALGLAVLGGGFLLPLVSLPGPAPVRLLPVLGAALLLAVGVLVAQPFVLELIPEFARAGLTGTYFGLFYLVSGVVAAAGTAAVGRAMDSGGGATGVPAVAWLCCAALGLASAGAVWLLHRSGRLAPAPTPAVPAVAPAPAVAGEGRA